VGHRKRGPTKTFCAWEWRNKKRGLDSLWIVCEPFLIVKEETWRDLSVELKDRFQILQRLIAGKEPFLMKGLCLR
jgi:hypothetical protein